MKITGILILAAFCVFCQSPNDKDEFSSEKIKNFYFPYAKMYDTLVYHYKTDFNDSEDAYWVMYTFNDKKDTFFCSYNFSFVEGSFLMIEYMKEKITSKGAFLKDYSEIYVNPFSISIISEAKIIKDEIFRWNLKTGDSLYFEFLTNDNGVFEGKHRVGKTRKLISTGDSIRVFHENDDQKKVLTARFTDSFTTQAENTDEKLNTTSSFNRSSWYADNIGLIKFEQEYESKTIRFKLNKIIPFQKWEQKVRLRAIMKENNNH